MPLEACCNAPVVVVPPVRGAYATVADKPVPPLVTARSPARESVVPVTVVVNPVDAPEILNVEFVKEPVSADTDTELDAGVCHVGRELLPVDVKTLPTVDIPLEACCTAVISEVPPVIGAYGVNPCTPKPPPKTASLPTKLKVVPDTEVVNPVLPPEILNAELVLEPASPDITGVVPPVAEMIISFGVEALIVTPPPAVKAAIPNCPVLGDTVATF
jgi:hypothetical protein